MKLKSGNETGINNLVQIRSYLINTFPGWVTLTTMKLF